MQWLQSLRQRLPQHKYAIDAAVLGDHAQLPWSNLGYWQAGQQNYAAACCALADHLGHSVNLNSKDKLLDLGCGQGASLLHWQQHYQVQYLAGVELQSACVANIQQYLPELNAIYQASFLRLTELQFSQRFDVVLCLDAAYHSPVPLLLEQIRSVLNSNARIGFHHLVLSERWKNLGALQRRKYQFLLKSADVNLKDLMTVSALSACLDHFEFKNIQIEDLSESVFSGFADYVQKTLNSKPADDSVQGSRLDHFKIRMTAKLCRKLYQEGIVRYVQVTAQSKN
ncbi:cyclopropane-fatty-acyl-phospholipid synthase family protein [Acinetobacter sp. BY484]|uniref:SAM-dependent methyltransferase n=1 Tax=Acinetobacter sp. BY484 TaxID=2820674 RepID=UPI001C219D20|nr:class I SAM-dependent methyltransferase [Acinetobacter sp. BY484]